MKIVLGETKFVSVSFVDEAELEDAVSKLEVYARNPQAS